MKKIFMVSGEVSGDRLGAWYLRQLRDRGQKYSCEAVGGNFLAQEGAALYARIDQLNAAGIVEVLWRLPSLWRFLKKLTAYILDGGFDEVVLVDFPGFNLGLARRLKRANPHLRITYVSPPQMWVWGAWRVRTIKDCCRDVVVLYPFEVSWYAAHGIQAQWLGYPLYENLAPYIAHDDGRTEKQIAFLLGSRTYEWKALLPRCLEVIRRFKRVHRDVSFVFPLAATISIDDMQQRVRNAGLWGNDIRFVQDEHEKYAALSRCCLAVTKPGTISLEVALLGIPGVIMYKVSPLTYWLAKSVVHVSRMGLPNLFLGEEVYPELLQRSCNPDRIFAEIRSWYASFVSRDERYLATRCKLAQLRKMLTTGIDGERTQKQSSPYR